MSKRLEEFEGENLFSILKNNKNKGIEKDELKYKKINIDISKDKIPENEEGKKDDNKMPENTKTPRPENDNEDNN